ncbi:MAG TPA: Zn-dependent hydrolase [Balneolaceae bacterium]|nr:Zn-dependent hydrolase [Balneolaceae bacterium]
MKRFPISVLLICAFVIQSCAGSGAATSDADSEAASETNVAISDNDSATSESMKERIDQYTTVELTTDMSKLTGNQKKVLALLIEASKPMNEIFWHEAYGEKSELMAMIDDPLTEKYAEINYGPWDRLNNNEPFVEGVGPKPAGANFYPVEMTKEEFEAWDNPKKDNLYTLVRYDDNGSLITVPYREAFAGQHQLIASKLKKAAEITENEALSNYLNLRAKALLTGEYKPSDIAWLEMKDNKIGIVIGPIETYEDGLFGYKAAHEAVVLVKDMGWSKRLARYAEVLPKLQKGLPVPEKYKQETPGSNADLNVYDAVFYGGSANAGAKTIAINLPNNPEIRMNIGTRRLQLKNVMRAKYEKILLPIADLLIVPKQQKYITFDAFFANTMFHEVAHGLGISQTITGKGTVREALKDHYSALEEGKADVLGLYMITSLRDDGMITEGNIKNNYVTFVASIFRSIRFGTGDAHGLANLIRFNFYKDKGAVSYDEEAQAYRVNFDKMKEASRALSRKILMLQGDGDYEGVEAFIQKYGNVGPQLRESLNRVAAQDIPTDVIFEQGKEVLGLE